MFIDPAIDVGDAAVRAVRGWGFNSRNTHSDVLRFPVLLNLYHYIDSIRDPLEQKVALF